MVVRTLVVALLLAAPLAAAGSVPSVVFFRDTEQGPAADGILSQDWPAKNESSVRPVLMELAGPSTVFVNIEERPGTHLKGPVFAGIWPDAAIANDARLHVTVMLDDETVSEAMVPVTIDPEAAPDPTGLVPPDPTDPEGAAFHVVGQVAPLILQPPTLVDLGTLDIEVPEGSELRIGLGIVAADGGPTVASMVLKYDGMLSPSYLYMPWWSADPAAESPQVKEIEQQSDIGDADGSDGTDGEDSGGAPAPSPSEDSPGIGMLMLLAIGAVAWLRRR